MAHHRMGGGGGEGAHGPESAGVPLPGMTSALVILVLAVGFFLMPFKWPRMFGAVVLVAIPLALISWLLGPAVFAPVLLGAAFWLSGQEGLWRKGK